MGSTDKTIGEYWRAYLGLKGTDDISDTNTHTGAWWRVVVIAAATFTTNTIVDGVAEDFSGTAVPAGTVLLGNFTAIDLASGQVVATQY